MKTFIGVGQGSAKDAVKKATQGLQNPSAILFIAPYRIMEETAALLWEAYPDVPMIGTIGTKLVNGQVGDDNLSVVGFFSDAKVSCGVIQNISKCPVAYAGEIQRKLSEISANREDTVCIEYCTGSEEKLVTTFTSCLNQKGISLVGGTAFGYPDGKQPIVAYNGKIYQDASVYAFIKNLTGKVRVFKENIYKKNSSQPHFATKVDVPRKALIELDGRPAADVYCKELGITRDKIVDNVLENPMGRTVGEQVFISSIMSVESNGTLLNFKRINKNDCIYILSLCDYKENERKTREKIKNEMGKISLVLSFDCGHRRLLYIRDNYLNTYAKDMSTLGQHMGVVVGGEQYNNQHVNQTMVCAVFE